MNKDNRPPTLTTTGGAPVADSRHSITAGPRGPILLQDYQMAEKLAYLARERIPERVLHAKGAAAFGTLRITGDIARHTRARVFQPGQLTPVLVRFSGLTGERGCADAERDMRGFALKAYTEEGNWDLVGSHLPVACIRDPQKFPDLVRALKRHPVSHLRSPTAIWDFWSLSPESIHQILMLFSDRGLPRSYRHMHGYGAHAFGLINEANERVWVKFHFRTRQGIRCLSDAEARDTIAEDRESAQRDLFEAIERGEHPSWSLHVQLMSDAQADALPFNPFDPTRVWPQDAFPLVELGLLTLDANPDNYFAQVEQATFNPAHMVPGLCVSPDKLLQGRLLAYADAQRYRVGTHHAALPVNRPLSPVHTYHADGAMRLNVPARTDAYYEPNSFGGPRPDRRLAEPALPLAGDAMRFDDRQGLGDYEQASALYRRMDDGERARLAANLASSMAGVPETIQRRQVEHFRLVDTGFGDSVEAALARRTAARLP
ncbi:MULTISPECIES: catalase [unclassified Variovorax]|uniref:catalase n=1 Tax=unclassified Variovorax TaxID=663243 RepID=UPI0008D2ECB0|nr:MULTISPECIES: catalase [unclassified Variovorax]SEK12626.1 catalase [Variovorax sp. OK202]SFD82611.1 catalase [Variovorax sp. OK212]